MQAILILLIFVFSNSVFAMTKGKVDILIIDDNSVSMELEQEEMGRRFLRTTTAVNWPK